MKIWFLVKGKVLVFHWCLCNKRVYNKRVYMDCIKVKKYVSFYVLIFFIWRQNMCRPRSAIRSLSWERRAVSLWTRYVFPREIKPRIHELSIRSSQIYFSTVLSAAKKLVSCRFGSTPRFWLPLVLRATKGWFWQTFSPSYHTLTFLSKLVGESIISVNLGYHYYFFKKVLI